jgi:hypothetical protein
MTFGLSCLLQMMQTNFSLHISCVAQILKNHITSYEIRNFISCLTRVTTGVYSDPDTWARNSWLHILFHCSSPYIHLYHPRRVLSSSFLAKSLLSFVISAILRPLAVSFLYSHYHFKHSRQWLSRYNIYTADGTPKSQTFVSDTASNGY